MTRMKKDLTSKGNKERSLYNLDWIKTRFRKHERRFMELLDLHDIRGSRVH
jgi:hypothetical protein